MPTYTYRCNKCEHQFDQRQKFSDDPLVECPNCNGRLRRLVNNAGGVVFKGSGFYVTDNRNGSKSKSSAKSTTETTDTSSSSDNGKTSESKSETKKSEKVTE